MRSFIMIALLLTACGTAPEAAKQAGAVATDAPSAPANGQDGAAGKDGLNGKDGVNGKDGKDGAAGKDGAQGAKGDKGDTGSAGAAGTAGQDGAQGIQGAQGAQGIQGASGAVGTPASTLTLIDHAGTVIGQVMDVSFVQGYILVVRGTLRFEVQPTTGNIVGAHVYFAANDCSGAGRMTFSTTNIDVGNLGFDTSSHTVRATGTDLGAMSSHSYWDGVAASCTVTTTSLTRTWAVQSVTLPFTFPIDRPEIQE